MIAMAHNAFAMPVWLEAKRSTRANPHKRMRGIHIASVQKKSQKSMFVPLLGVSGSLML
jgi:hypothetical protein